MKSNNFLDTDQVSQLYMGSLDSNDSYRPFPIMNQKRVVAGELSQGQVGDMRLQQGTYVVSSASVQSGISTVSPDVDHVPSNTNRQTSGESASLHQYLGCNTVFDIRLRVTFLRRKTVSLQSNIAHRE